ncbi:MAG: DegT/DnrJ/EryC1/StrS family aminotransferase [Thermoguttaceae bacterium]
MTGNSNRRNELAVDGAVPIRRKPWGAWPVFGEEDIAAVTAVLRSGRVNYWTGEETRKFEEEFSATVGCRYGVAMANGTLALEAALAALEIGPGDDVLVTCRSFVASASCCVVRGARPVFADVDPDSQNVTAGTLEAALTPRTRAIIAVHLAGWPCEMDAINRLAVEHGLAVIEDCAQAHGATYRGRPVGSLGDVAAFSFCQDKILTTGGEGGMVVTNHEDLWRRAWSMKDHGKDWDAVYRPDPAAVFRWIHASVGTNWRMTEMQGVLGRFALRRLPRWCAQRRRLAAYLESRLQTLPALRTTPAPRHVGHAYYKYYAFLRPECLRAGWDRDRVVRAIQAEGIPCGSGICPELYREGAFALSDSCPETPLPVAQRLGQTSLMFQVHPTLSIADMEDTCQAVERVLGTAAEMDRIVWRAA